MGANSGDQGVLTFHVWIFLKFTSSSHLHPKGLLLLQSLQLVIDMQVLLPCLLKWLFVIQCRRHAPSYVNLPFHDVHTPPLPLLQMQMGGILPPFLVQSLIRNWMCDLSFLLLLLVVVSLYEWLVPCLESATPHTSPWVASHLLQNLGLAAAQLGRTNSS